MHTLISHDANSGHGLRVSPRKHCTVSVTSMVSIHLKAFGAPVSTALEGPRKSNVKLRRLANMDSVQPVCSYPVMPAMSLSH